MIWHCATVRKVAVVETLRYKPECCGCDIRRKDKVKCTLVQALRLCTGRTAHRGSRGIAVPFHDHGTRRGRGVSFTPWPLFTPEKDTVPIVRDAVCAPGSIWTGAENLAPTGIRSPDRPPRSQSLYRLRYRAHDIRRGNGDFCYLFNLSSRANGGPVRRADNLINLSTV